MIITQLAVGKKARLQDKRQKIIQNTKYKIQKPLMFTFYP